MDGLLNLGGKVRKSEVRWSSAATNLRQIIPINAPSQPSDAAACTAETDGYLVTF